MSKTPGAPEGKAWVAQASEAIEYFQKYGPEERMTDEQRAEWERLVARTAQRADEHDAARGE